MAKKLQQQYVEVGVSSVGCRRVTKRLVSSVHKESQPVLGASI